MPEGDCCGGAGPSATAARRVGVRRAGGRWLSHLLLARIVAGAPLPGVSAYGAPAGGAWATFGAPGMWLAHRCPACRRTTRRRAVRDGDSCGRECPSATAARRVGVRPADGRCVSHVSRARKVAGAPLLGVLGTTRRWAVREPPSAGPEGGWGTAARRVEYDAPLGGA
ncbi:hypothetical protein AAII07_10390 [Microvirga sp. 0TCS3.31]